MNLDWRQRAACKGAPPNIFDTDDRPSGRGKGRQFLEDIDLQQQEVIAVYCRRCPVRLECLTYATNLQPIPSGVWGGLTERERLGGKKPGRSNRAITRALESAS
jgi:WhiB family redox-sensing transcriptional regulator